MQITNDYPNTVLPYTVNGDTNPLIGKSMSPFQETTLKITAKYEVMKSTGFSECFR
jgi:hypothetical protein